MSCNRVAYLILLLALVNFEKPVEIEYKVRLIDKNWQTHLSNCTSNHTHIFTLVDLNSNDTIIGFGNFEINAEEFREGQKFGFTTQPSYFTFNDFIDGFYLEKIHVGSRTKIFLMDNFHRID